jgi:sarcosine oxidase, subunit gamma
MLSVLTDAANVIRVQSWERGTRVPEPVARLLGIKWPSQVGAVACHGDELAVICIGPTDWLVLSGSGATLAQALDEQLRGSSFRAIDLSSAFARVRIDGAYARALLSKVCALDVHSDELRPGRAPRTLVAGLPVVVRCLAESVFECIVALSYCDYLVSWLSDAAREFSSDRGATA